METNGKTRTFVIGAIAGVVVAAALGAAFLLGGQAGGSNAVSNGAAVTQATPTSPAPGQTSMSATAPQAPTRDAPETDGGSQPQEPQPVPTETPAGDGDGDDEDAATATATATETATATATPTGECLYCLDGDIAIEPTPVDPCPLCNDLDLAVPVDTPPTISNISTSFCYPMLVVKFDLQDADSVWFSFSYDGVTHETQHIDADTFDGYLAKDMAYLGWGALLISNLRVHAKDDQGHQVSSGPIPVPDVDLGC